MRYSAVGLIDAGDMGEGQGAPAAAVSLVQGLGRVKAATSVSCRCSASGVTC